MAMAQRGPGAGRDDNRGDIDIEPKLVSGNSAENSTTTTTNQPVQEILESSQGEIKRRLGPVSEAGVSGARARNGPAVKDLNIRGNKHD